VRLQQLGDEFSPSRLMKRPYATAGVAIKVFVEQSVVGEVRILGEFAVIFGHRPLAISPLEKKARQTTPRFLPYVVQRYRYIPRK
jgi:hypothetical protein